MPKKPTYEELEQRVKELEKEADKLKLAEEALREKEEQYRGIFEAATDAFIIVDLDGIFVEANSAACKMYGYSREELIGLSGRDVVRPDYYHLFENFKKQLQSSKQFFAESVDMRKDGTQMDIEVRGTRFVFKGKQHLLATLRNVTDSKKTEEALRKSEEKYKALYDNAIVAMFRTSIRDSSVLAVNEVGVRLFGYSSKEEFLENFKALEHYADPNEREKLLNELKLRSQVENFQTKLTRKNGTTLWVEVSAKIYPTEGYLEGAVIDITKRKQAEEALQESEEKYRLVFDNAAEGIVVIQGDRAVFINHRMLEILGYYPKDLNQIASQPFLSFIHPDDQKMVAGRYSRRLKGEKLPSTYSIRFIRKDGESVWTDISPNVISWEGKESLLVFVTDIAERKQADEEIKKLEAQLQQAQKMEAMGTLAGGIAHDFNNLLMGIQGNASLMLLDIDSSHPNYEKLQAIEKMVQSGSRLTRQLLGYARKGKYEVKPINLNQLVMETSETFGRTRREIMIHREIEEDLSSIEADQGQIEQVLLNFYVNAADAMPGGGDLIFKTMNITHEDMKGKLYNPRPGKYVQLNVTDTGIGMDKKTQERIFEPFFTTKEMGRGTGLGLASAYGIIKAHGGYIDVDSEKGRGTTFSIYLPTSEKEVVKEKDFSEDILKGTETILLVDDEDIIIDVGEQMLKVIGYKAILARSGKKAIEVYKKKRGKIDMVILDMIMPGVSGGETYDRMKELNPNIKVLLSSGYSIDGQATEILERGCSGFIQKPFNIKELSQKLREILDKEKS